MQASAFSCNTSLHENEMFLRNLLFLKHPLGVRLSSMRRPRVANSQYKCHIFCQLLQDKLDIDLLSFSDLWHLCVRNRRNSLLVGSLSNSPFKKTYTCYQKVNHILWPKCKSHKHIRTLCVKLMQNSFSFCNTWSILPET